MKAIQFFLFILLAAFTACKQDAGTNSGEGDAAAAEGDFNWSDSEYYLNHPFSENFVSSIGNLGKSANVSPNKIMIDGEEPVEFPSNPAINRVYHLKGTRDNVTYKLDLVRINYSTVRFRLQIEKEGKVAENYEGDADINPAFYLGSETDTDELDAISYSANEFSYLKNACTTVLRIGGTPEGEVRARISRNCFDDSKDIALESSPTLR